MYRTATAFTIKMELTHPGSNEPDTAHILHPWDRSTTLWTPFRKKVTGKTARG